jgi:hypothetical protein
MRHESQELLGCAREVCRLLAVEAEAVPVEGYHYQDMRLAEYFRALDAEPVHRRREVEGDPAFQRLCGVRTSAIFGRPAPDRGLLPLREDPLAGALIADRPTWTVAAAAEAFTRTFNALFDDHRPAPAAANAAAYWEAAARAAIVGRCACIGDSDDGRFYHLGHCPA